MPLIQRPDYRRKGQRNRRRGRGRAVRKLFKEALRAISNFPLRTAQPTTDELILLTLGS